MARKRKPKPPKVIEMGAQFQPGASFLQVEYYRATECAPYRIDTVIRSVASPRIGLGVCEYYGAPLPSE